MVPDRCHGLDDRGTSLAVSQAQERQPVIQKKEGTLVDRARAKTVLTWPVVVVADVKVIQLSAGVGILIRQTSMTANARERRRASSDFFESSVNDDTGGLVGTKFALLVQNSK